MNFKILRILSTALITSVVSACVSPPLYHNVMSRPVPQIVEMDLKPIKVEQPCFPMKAIRQHAEGWVQVEFSLDQSGKVTELVTLDNSPPGLFENCAIDSMKQWVFEIPKAHQPDNRYQFVFKFELG
ncbi:MAG: energy transducer TonB [Kangiellaceae bacterium]|nr:energy transducer TonB [Kangiellaceae bacterium]MCW8997834.1 energy transducer TonB [Kangiellaceae bacterium]